MNSIVRCAAFLCLASLLNSPARADTVFLCTADEHIVCHRPMRFFPPCSPPSILEHCPERIIESACRPSACCSEFCFIEAVELTENRANRLDPLQYDGSKQLVRVLNMDKEVTRAYGGPGGLEVLEGRGTWSFTRSGLKNPPKLYPEEVARWLSVEFGASQLLRRDHYSPKYGEMFILAEAKFPNGEAKLVLAYVHCKLCGSQPGAGGSLGGSPLTGGGFGLGSGLGASQSFPGTGFGGAAGSGSGGGFGTSVPFGGGIPPGAGSPNPSGPNFLPPDFRPRPPFPPPFCPPEDHGPSPGGPPKDGINPCDEKPGPTPAPVPAPHGLTLGVTALMFLGIRRLRTAATRKV